jgi:hypothetical protein
MDKESGPAGMIIHIPGRARWRWTTPGQQVSSTGKWRELIAPKIKGILPLGGLAD